MENEVDWTFAQCLVSEGCDQIETIQLEVTHDCSLQGCNTWPTLFSAFINHLYNGTVCTLRKFANDMDLRAVAGTQDGCAVL